MNLQPGKTAVDYLIVGHITRDIIEKGFRLGGTAVYSGILAKRMGLNVGLVTSYNEETPVEPLNGIQIINQRAKRTTTFKNNYTPSGREQFILERAKPLGLNQIPAEWRVAKIVHLGPVAREISLEIGFNFPGAALCFSLQGWLREWDRKGLIQPSPFPKMNNSFAENTAAFLSIEDLGFNRSLIDPLRSLFPLLVLTKGNTGAEIFWQEKTISIPVKPKDEVDPTGAGDIFAAAFMINYVLKGKKLIESAQTASALAAISVTRPGIEGIPTAAEIQSIQEVH